MSDIAHTVGNRLRSYRLARGMSQERLAEGAGLHPTYIGQVERGEKNLTIESLEKITRALGVPMSNVFEKIEGRHEENNYALMAYDLLSHLNDGEREKLYGILEQIEGYTER